MSRQKAILIIGPTASGKSPLGDCLEARSLWGHSCYHFDFGEQLRAIVDHREGIGVSESEADYIQGLLERGALLENETFYLAEKILQHFIASHALNPDDYMVLNGMPRHIGQAMGVDRILNITTIVALECSAEVVLERIKHDTGGDRSQRIDDDIELVRTKLEIFNERTKPLLVHYQTYGSTIYPLTVASETQATDLVDQLELLKNA